MSSVSWALKSRTPLPCESEIPPCASSTELRHEPRYRDLSDYCSRIEQTNPGSIAVVSKMPDSRFDRLFLCYGALVSKFASCRPHLGLDDSYLKNKYKGVCLTLTLSLTHAQVSCFLPLV